MGHSHSSIFCYSKSMLNVNLSTFAKPVVHQRRFRYLLAGLLLLSLCLGILVVPIEQSHPEAVIQTYEDGVWWSVVTVTGVGYGDMVPKTRIGRVFGVVLIGVGVLSYGLIVSMFSWALVETRDRYYRVKMFEQLEDIQSRLDQMLSNNLRLWTFNLRLCKHRPPNFPRLTSTIKSNHS